MKLYQRFDWGWGIYRREGRGYVQTGAAVGLPLSAVYPEPLTAEQSRSLRKHGMFSA